MSFENPEENISNQGSEVERSEVSEVAERFEKELGIKKEDLENLEGFKDLSRGQQLLVLENLKQINLGRIEEEAAEAYKKNTAEAKWMGKIWKGLTKNYQLRKLEKQKAKDTEEGDLEAKKNSLKQLVQGMNNFGPQVKEKEGGQLEIQFVSGLENLSEEEQKIVDEFNDIANIFARIPDEWSYGEASKKEKKEYQEAKKKYEEAKKSLLGLKRDKLGEKGAFVSTNEEERQVKLSQILNENPYLEKRLKSIKNESALKGALKDIATERGLYLGAGFLARSVTTSMLGVMGAPLAAAGIGYWRGKGRAKEGFKEKDKSERRGASDKLSEEEKQEQAYKYHIGDKNIEKKATEGKKDFVDASYISESLEFLTSEMQGLAMRALANKNGLAKKNKERLEELARSLRNHIDDAFRKMEKGEINFGAQEERVANQYNLMQSLGQAQAFENSYKIFDKTEILKKYNKDKEEIEKYLNELTQNISEDRKKEVRKQARKGATYAAGFALAGSVIRWAGEELGWWGEEASQKAAQEAVVEKSAPSSEGQIPEKEIASSLEEKIPEKESVSPPKENAGAGSAEEEIVRESVSQAESPQVPESAVIKKGEGIEHAFIRQLKADPEKFGFEGDLDNAEAVNKWAGQQAHRIALNSGYVDASTGQEVRISGEGAEKAAYVLETDDSGNIKVREHFAGEEGELHEAGAEFEKEEEQEGYEYGHKESKEPKFTKPEDLASKEIHKTPPLEGVIDGNVNISAKQLDSLDIDITDPENKKLILYFNDNPELINNPAKREYLQGLFADQEQISRSSLERAKSIFTLSETISGLDNSLDSYQKMEEFLTQVDFSDLSQDKNRAILENLAQIKFGQAGDEAVVRSARDLFAPTLERFGIKGNLELIQSSRGNTEIVFPKKGIPDWKVEIDWKEGQIKSNGPWLWGRSGEINSGTLKEINNNISQSFVKSNLEEAGAPGEEVSGEADIAPLEAEQVLDKGQLKVGENLESFTRGIPNFTVSEIRENGSLILKTSQGDVLELSPVLGREGVYEYNVPGGEGDDLPEGALKIYGGGVEYEYDYARLDDYIKKNSQFLDPSLQEKINNTDFADRHYDFYKEVNQAFANLDRLDVSTLENGNKEIILIDVDKGEKITKELSLPQGLEIKDVGSNCIEVYDSEGSFVLSTDLSLNNNKEIVINPWLGGETLEEKLQGLRPAPEEGAGEAVQVSEENVSGQARPDVALNEEGIITRELSRDQFEKWDDFSDFRSYLEKQDYYNQLSGEDIKGLEYNFKRIKDQAEDSIIKAQAWQTIQAVVSRAQARQG